jgi:hypothetical protein
VRAGGRHGHGACTPEGRSLPIGLLTEGADHDAQARPTVRRGFVSPCPPEVAAEAKVTVHGPRGTPV